MAGGLDRCLREWCEAVEAGPFHAIAVGKRIGYDNLEMHTTSPTQQRPSGCGLHQRSQSSDVRHRLGCEIACDARRGERRSARSWWASAGASTTSIGPNDRSRGATNDSMTRWPSFAVSGRVGWSMGNRWGLGPCKPMGRRSTPAPWARNRLPERRNGLTATWDFR